MQKTNFLIIGIGASAGGLNAIKQLFDHLQDDTGAAYVIIQHLSPDFKSLMPELLAKHTNMKIFTAKDKQVIKPNCIYLNHRDKNLIVRGNKFYLLDRASKNNLNLPIDIFFKSLGEEFGEKSVGVVLSGTGTDSCRGVKDINEHGGTVIVQDPKTAQFDGMPKSSISTNIVDFILDPKQIAKTISNLPRQEINLQTKLRNKGTNKELFQNILEQVYQNSSIDFKLYKNQTLLRRLEKRLGINNVDNFKDYLSILYGNPDELAILKQEFLIGVTRFFRDKEAFNTIRLNVIPNLFNNAKEGQVIRIWTAGCSTGEEAYSLAILLDDYIRRNNINNTFKIFATDVDQNAVNYASLGTYNINVGNEIEKYYLENYFIKRGEKIEVLKRIRQKIVFSCHDITTDPPFIKLDLITCRNLLIYLNKQTQENILKSFKFSLKANTYLFLGPSESLGASEKSFKIIDNRWNVYKKISNSSYSSFVSPAKIKPNFKKQFGNNPNSILSYRNTQINKEGSQYQKALCNYFSPSSILLDKDYNILYIQGDAGKKLLHQTGIFERNIMRLVSPKIASKIRVGFRNLNEKNKDIIVKDISYNNDGLQSTFDLTLTKVNLDHTAEVTYLIYFSEDKIAKRETFEIKNDVIAPENQKYLGLLEEEITRLKLELQHVVQELETSNEELQSSNEELMSSNEELQSTNEELQSVNEELTTVNTDLQEKNLELKILSDDISNLMESTNISTLFLDKNLHIRKFTEPLANHFKIKNIDVGRSIDDLNSNFSKITAQQFITDCKTVLKKAKLVEREIQDQNNNYFLLRVNPYITINKIVDGVSLSFIDINELKRKEKQLELKTIELNHAQEIAEIGNWSYNLETGDIFWSNQLFKMYQFKPEDGVPSFPEQEKLFTPDSWKKLQKAVEDASTKGISYEIELEFINKSGSIGWMLAKGIPYKNNIGKINYLRGVVQNITKGKLLNQKLNREKQLVEKITNQSASGIFIYNTLEKTNTFINSKFQKILGWSKEEINSFSKEEYFALFHPSDVEIYKKHLSLVMSGKEYVKIEYRFKHKKGHWVWCYSVDSAFDFDANGNVISMIGVFIDITENKKTEEKLNYALKKAEAANIYKNQFLANMSHEIRTPINGITGFAELLDKDNLKPEQRKRFVDIIKSSSKQLLSLINDIMDVSKIEAGELSLKLSNCNLTELFNNLKETFLEDIKHRKGKGTITLSLKINAKDKDLYILADESKLLQVMSNLITNAIKYSNSGNIEFGYTVIDKQKLRFYVQDQGTGIPKHKLNAIFKRFEQVNDENHEEVSGTGLGLSIVKGITDLMNGKVEVVSEYGKGSIFTVTIPFTKIDKDKSIKTTKVASALDSIKLLIAEDNGINQELFRTIFSNSTIEYIIASNGQEAVDYYKENPDIEVILMDIRMPIVDGIDAAKQILNINPKAKIIAQTAFALSSDEEKLMKEGFSDYISKPIDRKLLFKKISHLVKK